MSNTKEKEDLKKYSELCKKCSGDKIYYIALTVVKCFNCLKQYNLSTAPSVTNDSTLIIKQKENNTEKRTYSFRNNKINAKIKSDFKPEPEIIELLSSDDDSNGTSASKEDDLNNDASNDKNGDSNSKNGTPQTNGNSAKYIFKEWEIKETDTESLETILNGESKTLPKTKEIAKKFNSNSDIFEKKIKNFRLGSFISASQSIIEISSEGLNFKLMIREDEEEDLLVSITICMQDIVYCAIVFHNPVYALFIRIHEPTSNLYYNQLKELKSFQTSHIDRNNKSRITALLDISKSEEAETSRQLYSFFKRLPVSSEIPFRSNFIKLLKSKQLVYSVFRNDKSLADVACFTKECLANDLAKPILKYPSGDDSVEISNLDLSCLDDGVFLNDNIISFYLKYLQYEVLTEQDRKRTHIFDTFFYQCLTTKSQKKTKDDINLSAAERRHSRVKNWTRNVDLFKKDFLIFPINKNNHWYLVIICYPYLSEPIYEDRPYKMEEMDTDDEKKPGTDFNIVTDLKKNNRTERNTTDMIGLLESDQSADEADEDDSNFSTIFSNNKENNKICIKMPIILVFDSLLSTKKTRVIATLREYLQCEWKTKFGTEEKRPLCLDKLAGTCVKVPIQTNYFDCGIYLLQYVEQFFKDPITDFILPIGLDKWFTTDIINKKRDYIRNMILTKSKEKTPKIETKDILQQFNPTIQSDEENAKKQQVGSLKKTNGYNKEVKESTNNTIKKIKLTESQNDPPKSPIRSRLILRKEQDESKSKHILDDMDNLISN